MSAPFGKPELHPESIPAELKAIPRWLLWRLEDRAGKPAKVPYQADGRPAKVNDPATWTTFETALAAYLAGGWSGLGIALAEDDDLTGVDLDKCLNPDTGELDPEAEGIVAMLPTYCEVSPSGRGLRLFAFGKLPQGGRRKGKVEMYESGRYLTVTGHRFNGHDSIAECTAELAEVHARIFGTGTADDGSKPVDSKPRPADPPDLDDAALLDKARNARNGDDFDRLWNGDLSGHGGDASAADLALCNALAFWTGGDAARIDRLFRQSGLMRPKWDKAHYSDGRTYGQATIVGLSLGRVSITIYSIYFANYATICRVQAKVLHRKGAGRQPGNVLRAQARLDHRPGPAR
jgi:primase-polymerase (primpol)-like protein